MEVGPANASSPIILSFYPLGMVQMNVIRNPFSTSDKYISKRDSHPLLIGYTVIFSKLQVFQILLDPIHIS